MNEPKKLHLPIGYWLKKADEVLTARINGAQLANGLSRTEWQMLNVLHEVREATHEQLATPMRPFANAAALGDAVLRLTQNGLIEGDGSAASQYQLTRLGQEKHEAALSQQKEIRQRAVMDISEPDYTTAVRVLQQLVQNLSGEGAAQQGAQAEREFKKETI